MTLVDDWHAPAIGELGKGPGDLSDKFVADLAVDDHIVRGYGRLPRIDELAEGDLASGHIEAGRGSDDCWALATKLQRDRDEVLSSSLHHGFPDRGTSGEEAMIWALVDDLEGFGRATLDHSDGIGVDMAGQQLSK
jgi:hypothetical protein